MAHAIRQDINLTAEEIIRAMALEHGVTPERTPTDAWADTITRLSGDEVVNDEIQDLVVALERRGVLSADDGTQLYGRYLKTL